MSVTPDDFLKSALEFAASGLGEINQRNAISRAYYASYHQACGAIAPDGKPRYTTAPDGTKRTLGMHTGYIEQLKESQPSTIERSVGVKLGAIYSGRIIADYRLKESVSPKSYTMQIARTQELFKLIENNNASLNRQPLTQTPVQNTSSTTQIQARLPSLRVVK